MPTKVVVAFDSDSPQTDEEKKRVDGSSEFAQVFEALEHSFEVAENVFARCSKIEFRSLVGEARMREAKDVGTVRPIWVSENRVVLGRKDDIGTATELLKGLVLDLAYSVEHSAALLPVPGGDLVLVGSLNTRVSPIGEDLFSFSVKQRWGFHAKKA